MSDSKLSIEASEFTTRHADAEQWEEIKKMGDATIAAYREKFAGPS